MEENIDNNKIIEDINDPEVFEFNYNFINQPWDDRSDKSKIGIVALLVIIFAVTMACVINNFIMHFKDFGVTKTSSNEINCLRMKIEDFPYVARIHSVSSKELLCVGAVVSPTSIIASGVCVKSGPIRVQLGNPALPQCKKGFTVDVIESIYHEGIISKKLALLSSYDNIARCSSDIKIGKGLDWNSQAHIIGRPLNFERFLTKQQVTLIKKDTLPKGFNFKHLKVDSLICVKDLARCPVRAGDLLVQNGQIYGISSTSVHRTDEDNIACFSDFSTVRIELKELDVEIR